MAEARSVGGTYPYGPWPGVLWLSERPTPVSQERPPNQQSPFCAACPLRWPLGHGMVCRSRSACGCSTRDSARPPPAGPGGWGSAPSGGAQSPGAQASGRTCWCRGPRTLAAWAAAPIARAPAGETAFCCFLPLSLPAVRAFPPSEASPEAAMFPAGPAPSPSLVPTFGETFETWRPVGAIVRPVAQSSQERNLKPFKERP